MSRAESSSRTVLEPFFRDYDEEFEEVGKILEGDSHSQWVLAVKEALVDDFIYNEVLHPNASEVLDRLADELDLGSSGEVIDAVRSGELYDRLLEVGVRKENDENPYENSIFEDEVEISDALAIDYTLRGGKRLRPALALLTEYGLKGEVSANGMAIGSSIEVVHASSLVHDDDMDGDPLRRDRLSSERINRAYYDEKGWMHSVLDGNKMEAWANKNVVALTGREGEKAIPADAAEIFFETEVELNNGQKRDLELEEKSLRETGLEDYNSMIEGKTGALYRAGIEMVLEDHFSVESYTADQEDEIRDEFDRYITNFNILFQAGDDAIEVFNPEATGKSVTDIPNRKNTFPALVTKQELQEKDPEYAELFLNIFDEEYDEVTEEMKETAREMGVPISLDHGERYGDEWGWEEEWIRETILEYGEEPSNQKAREYLEEATSSIERLYREGEIVEGERIINEAARDKYISLAEFVWDRNH